MNTLLQDLRYAFRKLRKTPGFTAMAVLTLALGLTVNATIFFLINDLFLRPLPATDPERLVVIGQTTTMMPMIVPFSYPDYQDFSDLSKETAMNPRRWRRLFRESWLTWNRLCR